MFQRISNCTSSLFLLVFISLQAIAQMEIEAYLERADSLLAIEEYEASFQLYSKVFIDDSFKTDQSLLVRALIGKGVARRYDHIPKPSEALTYLRQAYAIAITLSEFPIDEMANLYYHLGTTERELNNYETALNYLELALKYGEQIKAQELIAKCNHAIANVYNSMREFEKAETYYISAIDSRDQLNIKNDKNLNLYYFNLAISFQQAQQYDKSNVILQKLTSFYDSYEHMDSSTISYISMLYALNYCYLKNKEKAEFHLAVLDAYKKPDSKELYETYWQMGKIQNLLGRYDKAALYFQKSLVEGIYKFESLNIFDTPVLEDGDLESQMYAKEYIYEILKDKGVTLQKIYEENNDVRILEVVRNTFELADKITFRLRINLGEEDASLHTASHAYPIYEFALANLYEIAQRDSQFPIIDDVFKYMERNKQLLLLRKKKLNDQIGLNKKKIADLQKVQFAFEAARRRSLEQSDEDNDYSSVAGLEELLHLHQDKTNIFDSLNVSYSPLIFEPLSIDEVQSILVKDEVILSYYWGKTSLFVLSISKSKAVFDRISIKMIDVYIDEFLSLFILNDKLEIVDDIDKFVNKAHFLYKTLVAPYLDKKYNPYNTNHLLIIPDGKLSAVSFSALVQDAKVPSNNSYEKLNYLIKDYEVSYSFSVANRLSDMQTDKAGDSFIGFTNSSLFWTQKEVQEINKIWKIPKGMRKKDYRTEEIFKNEAIHYDVLHLSLHATSGSLEEEAYLQFDTDSSSAEDGKLYNYEIYPMTLSARLVTLSACETGLGIDKVGEGVYSLARGFNFAGCPTVIMSLWNVPDMNTFRLMPFFYKKLKNRNRVSKSLQQAQIRYIDSERGLAAHPFNWAGFVIIGDAHQVIYKNKRYVYIGLFLISCIFGGLIILSNTMFKSKFKKITFLSSQ